jgi:hypothetical protein
MILSACPWKFHALLAKSGPFFLCCLILLLSAHPGQAQDKCNTCEVPAFAAITVYHVLQSGPAMGFGIEAGKWKKDAGKFSYFLGTSLVWSTKVQNDRKEAAGMRENFISFYWKGQYQVANRFYLIGQPELVNLSSFELRAGLRYVVPLTKGVGIGLEPGYALIRRDFSIHTNIHFSLR